MTIAELERFSGLRRRTIHYYTQNGLLPAPEGSGRAARYHEGHLLRLRLIPLLKAGGLRLDGIARALGSLSSAQMESLLTAAELAVATGPPGLPDWIAGALGGAAPRAGAGAAGTVAPPLRRGGGTASPPSRRAAVPVRWERHAVNEQLEVHLRDDAHPEIRRRLADLMRYARRLCEPAG